MYIFFLSCLFLILLPANAVAIVEAPSGPGPSAADSSSSGPGLSPINNLYNHYLTDKPERPKTNRFFGQKITHYLADQQFFYQLRFSTPPNPVNSKEEYLLRKKTDPLFKDLPRDPEKKYRNINTKGSTTTFPQNGFSWNHYLGLHIIQDHLGFTSKSGENFLNIFNLGLKHLGIGPLESSSKFPDLFHKNHKDYFAAFLIIFNVGLAQHDRRMDYYITSPSVLSAYTEGLFEKVPEVSTWLKGFPNAFFDSVFTSSILEFVKIKSIDDVPDSIMQNNDFFKHHKKGETSLSAINSSQAKGGDVPSESDATPPRTASTSFAQMAAEQQNQPPGNQAVPGPESKSPATPSTEPETITAPSSGETPKQQAQIDKDKTEGAASAAEAAPGKIPQTEETLQPENDRPENGTQSPEGTALVPVVDNPDDKSNKLQIPSVKSDFNFKMALDAGNLNYPLRKTLIGVSINQGDKQTYMQELYLISQVLAVPFDTLVRIGVTPDSSSFGNTLIAILFDANDNTDFFVREAMHLFFLSLSDGVFNDPHKILDYLIKRAQENQSIEALKALNGMKQFFTKVDQQKTEIINRYEEERTRLVEAHKNETNTLREGHKNQITQINTEHNQAVTDLRMEKIAQANEMFQLIKDSKYRYGFFSSTLLIGGGVLAIAAGSGIDLSEILGIKEQVSQIFSTAFQSATSTPVVGSLLSPEKLGHTLTVAAGAAAAGTGAIKCVRAFKRKSLLNNKRTELRQKNALR